MSDPRPASYRDALGVAEFRALFTAEVASLLGDQIAAVGLAVLLYQRTGSALVSALGYAAVYLPWTVGGPLLAALADRMPARRVLVGGDLVRAALIGLAALPVMPLPVLASLVFAAALLAPPFEAAGSALLPQILDGDRYAVATSVRNAVHQFSQLAGFIGGGALVAVISPHGALAVDAATFAASAALLRRGLRHRPPASGPARRRHLLRETVVGIRIVARDRALSGPLLLGIVGAAYTIVPEAIAPAYARSLGHGPRAVGLIMAAAAGGTVAGNLLLGRFVGPRLRRRLMWPMALAGVLPLTAVALHPGLVLSLTLFALAGACSSFQVAANTVFAQAAPAGARGRVFGVAMTGMYTGQAVAILAAGAAAQLLPPGTVVAGAAVLGGAAVLALGPSVGTRRPRHAAAVTGLPVRPVAMGTAEGAC